MVHASPPRLARRSTSAVRPRWQRYSQWFLFLEGRGLEGRGLGVPSPPARSGTSVTRMRQAMVEGSPRLVSCGRFGPPADGSIHTEVARSITSNARLHQRRAGDLVSVPAVQLRKLRSPDWVTDGGSSTKSRPPSYLRRAHTVLQPRTEWPGWSTALGPPRRPDARHPLDTHTPVPGEGSTSRLG